MKNSTFKNWRFTTDMMMCDYILSEDHEHSMARSEIKVIQSAINRLMQKLKGEGNIEAWVQSKITKAADYIDTAADYLDSQDNKIEEQNQGPSSPVKSYYPPEDNPGAPIIIGPNRGAAGIKYPVRYKTPLATNTPNKSKVQMASYEPEGDQIDEVSLPGTGTVMAPSGGVPYVQKKVLGVTVPFSQNIVSPSTGGVKKPNQYNPNNTEYSSTQVQRYNATKSAPSVLKPKEGNPEFGYTSVSKTPEKPRPSFFKKPDITSTTKPAEKPTPPPTTASGAMAQGLKDVPVLGAVANIAKKYDDKVNYRNQPPEIRKQMGLQNSYDFESEVFVEEKKNNCNEEGLRDWFGKSKSKDGKSGWVNVVTGGTCASDEPGEGTPKCVSSSKRASMTDTERKSAARRKKLADPGQQSKSGAAKPTYVATDVKEESDTKTKGSGTKDACYTKVKSRYSVWPSAYASGALVKCRKVGATNWGTKSESTNSLDGDWHTPIRERADRYCPKCEKLERRSECKYGSRYWDMFSLPAEIISSKKDYNITMPYPANEETNIDENYLRIQTRGSTYTILINWRGKYITTQMFFQQFTRPTKTEVTREIRKVYPNAIVLAFNPSANDPNKPLLFTGEPNGPKSY